MRVVFNGRFLSQVRTGVQRYATETLLALDELLDDPARPSNLEFELAIPPDASPVPLKHIRCVEIGKLTGHLWEQIDLFRHARGAYLVNFNYSGPLLMRRQLVTIHDATVRAMPQAFSRAYRWTHNILVSVLGRTAHAVMTVSNFSRDELGARFGLARNDIIVGVEGGEHVQGGDADEAAVLRKHGLRAGQYVLGVGSVKPNKNFELIAQAMRLLPGFTWPVAIAGAKDIGIFKDASSLDDSFVFLGFVSDEELAVLYRRAACFVFPSSYEGFGLPAFEAMAQGCPVLCARAAAMPEVCGDAVLYFEHDDPGSLADALIRIQRDPALREALVVAGTRRLNDYNWRRNAHILLDHLVAQVPRPPLPEKPAPAPQGGTAPDTSPPAVRTAAPSTPLTSGPSAPPGRPKALTAPPGGSERSERGGPLRAPAAASRAVDEDDEPIEPLAAAGDGVLHVTECLASGTLSFLEQATHELVRAGVPQTVMFSRRPDTPAEVEQRFDARVRLIELPSPRNGVWPYYRRLRTQLREQVAQHRYTAVHLHSSKAGFMGRMALAGTTRPPLFYSPHGLAFLDRRYLVPSLAFTALERIAARVDATLVGCGEGEAELLKRVGGNNVRVVENTVPNAFFAIERRPLDPPVVMTMGRVCRQKGPEFFAELAARFHLAEVPASFVWVGDGDPAGEAMLRAAGVKVTGWVPPELVRQHLAQASIYVQTSLWEGMPLSVLQALASGLPCVVTDVVGNRDAVQQGITGYVARHPEALAMCVRRLLVDAALYARMSRAARADALERFTGRNLRRGLLRLYGLPEMYGLAAGEPMATAFDDYEAHVGGVAAATAVAGAWRTASHGTQAGAVS
jgi:glycosyltransferase involved in cell wall biosynthesis